MHRRDLIFGLGLTLATLAAGRAQQSPLPVIGFMSARSFDDSAYLIAAFRRGLRDGGFVEGENVAIEYRWAKGDYGQLPALARDLLERQVAVLVAVGGDASALAAKRATSTVPIVFGIGSDPVALGLVESISRPGGNATGVNVLTSSLEAKRLGILNELVPAPGPIGALVNPEFPPAAHQVKEITEAAQKIGRPVTVLHASRDSQIEAAFATLSEQSAVGLLVSVDPYFDTRRKSIIRLAARHRLPAIYQFREYAVDGGLMSYGVDLADAYRHFGAYAARLLKGEDPAMLPVMQSTRFQFVINLGTTRALGLIVPQVLLAQADEVIE